MKQYLTEKVIGTAIHYPLALHFQGAFRYLGYKKGDFPKAEKGAEEVLSLPIYNTLTDEEVDYVILTIKSYFDRT